MIQNGLNPFTPHPLFAGGHLQTIVGYYLPENGHIRASIKHRVITPDGDTIILHENKATRKSPLRKSILLMHGLAGSADASYMRRLTILFGARGWQVFRMEHRGCGAGEGLARSTYHSGRSDDINLCLKKIAELLPETPLIAIGFSLSGNALLKLLGEGKEDIPAELCGAIAVTPPIELAECADKISEPANKIYEYRFTRRLKKEMKERGEKYPEFREIKFPLYTSIRMFDDLCTAPINGYVSADNYYSKCSAKQFLHQIKLSTFLLASQDDPFIPASSFENLPQNDSIEYCITASGGHMGFVARDKTVLGDGRWMDYAVVYKAEEFVKKALE